MKEMDLIDCELRWCGYCKQARQYFQRNGIAFRERDIERSSSAKRAHQRLGGGGVPVIVLGDHVMRGFDQRRFDVAYQDFQSELAAAKADSKDEEPMVQEAGDDIKSTLEALKKQLLNYF